MYNDQQIRAVIARGVSIMICYRRDTENPRVKCEMIARAESLGGLVDELAMCPSELDRLILRPVKDELMVRYGPDIGPKLYAEFLAAFDDGLRLHHEAAPPAPEHDSPVEPPVGSEAITEPGGGNEQPAEQATP